MNLTETKDEICVKESEYVKGLGFETLTIPKIHERNRITTSNSLGLFCLQLKASDCCNRKCYDCAVFKTRVMFLGMADDIEELKRGARNEAKTNQ